MISPVPNPSVPKAKVTEYLLNPRHETGGPKSAFFSRFGFSAERWQEMAAALIDHPERNPTDTVTPSRWGARYVVRCTISTPDGRNPCILSVWNVSAGSSAAVLVTAYPANETPA